MFTQAMCTNKTLRGLVVAILMFGLVASTTHAETSSTSATITALQAQIKILQEQLVKLGVRGVGSTVNSNAVEVGDRVQTTTNLNVRSEPSSTGTRIATEPVGNMGTVLAGPARMVGGVIKTSSTTTGIDYWQVKYDSGVTGWSSVVYLRDAGSTYTGGPTNPAKCTSFTFTPSSVKKGASTTATWTTENAVRVVLMNGRGDLVREFVTENSFTFVPDGTGLYQINVYGNNNTKASCTATITVATVVTSATSTSTELAVCNSFKLSPANAKKGSEVTLSWDTTNVSKVYITNTLTSGVVEKEADGSLVFTAEKLVTYFLSVDGLERKRVLCSATLVVQDVSTPGTQPICNSFVSDPNTVKLGSSTKLTWNTTNAKHTAIVSTGGYQKAGLPADGSVTVTPTGATYYTLYAFGSDGTKVSCTAPVLVI